MKRKINSKKIVFAIIIIICIIIVIARILIKRLNQNNENSDNVDPDTSLCGYTYSNDNSMGITEYFNIKKCMDTYLNSLNKNGKKYYGYDVEHNYVKTADDNSINKTILNMLSENYILKNNISINNIDTYINTFDSIKDEYMYIPLESKLLQQKQITTYLIHGLIENYEYNVIGDIFVIINLDMINNTFSIEPIKGEYTSIDEINVGSIIDSIKKNESNSFIPSRVKDSDIAKNFMNLCKNLLIGKPDIMYSFLDENYRNTRFGSSEAFVKYATENKEQLKNIKAYGFNRKDENDYTRYICVDTNNNYYIFDVTTLMQYTVILDTYTIDLPEFTEKYNQANTQEKVILNLNKINLALNAKDYKYVYNKLADSFKNNNFKTLEEFEEYAKSNFYKNNKFEYVKFETEAEDYYTYSVVITDDSGEQIGEVNKTFIMKLRRRNRLYDII